MKAIAFDLGNTLVEYEGLPLSWEAYYREALANLAMFLGIAPDPRDYDQACAVLRRYNTRITPRVEEVPFAAILEHLLRAFRLPLEADELRCASVFFRVFRQKLRCFPETVEALAVFRRRKIKIGVFTDVPYGMPRELVLEDVGVTAVAELLDVLITSRDVGLRKPSPATLKHLAEALTCNPDEMVYVGDEKKDVEVARAFGCRSILIDRAGNRCDWGQDQTIRSLSEI